MPKKPQPALRPPSPRRATATAAGIIAAAAFATYLNSFFTPFVWDDVNSIAGNATIRRLWPIWRALSPPEPRWTVSGRPILNLSLAVNYAISGTEVWSYHALNLLIHILAALTLFGIARRTLEKVGTGGPPVRTQTVGQKAADLASGKNLQPTPSKGRLSRSEKTLAKAEALARSTNPTILAFAIALLWTVHPLQTESVTYIIQRAESLMGLFYLLTLYCFIRGAELEETPFAGPEADRSPESSSGRALLASLPASGPRDLRAAGSAGSLGLGQLRPSRTRLWRTIRLRPRGCWYALSVLACLLGMATKEVMVSAPVIVFLYDRTFISGGFREAWRRHRRIHLALAATWLPLAWLVLQTGNRGGSAGAGIGVTWWSYALTQFPAIARYLRLVVWPHPQAFDYGTQWVRDGWAVLPSAALVIALAVAAGYAFLRPPAKQGGFGWQALGFAGVWFFAILAPTSLIPGNRQTMAEHRMYLALAPVIAAAVWGIHAWLGRRSLRLLAVIAVGLSLVAFRRNEVYQSETSLWTDSVLQCPDNPYARDNLGALLAQAGNLPAAAGQFAAVIKLKPDDFFAHNNWGTLLMETGRPAEAIVQYRDALRTNPSFAPTHYNLGNALLQTGQPAAALEQFAEAVRINPDHLAARYNLAYLLAQNGRLSEAIAQYRQVLQRKPDFREAHHALGLALRAAGRNEEAAIQFQLAQPPGATP